MADTLLPSALPTRWGWTDLDNSNNNVEPQADDMIPRATDPTTDASQALQAILRLEDIAHLTDATQPVAIDDAGTALSNFIQQHLPIEPNVGEDAADKPMVDAGTDPTLPVGMEIDSTHHDVEHDQVMQDAHDQGADHDEPMGDVDGVEGNEQRDYEVLFENNQHSLDQPLIDLDDDAIFGPGLMNDSENAVPRHNYELRPGFRSDVVPGGAEREDHDETADFSPAEEARQLRLANRRRKAAARRTRTTDVDSTEGADSSDEDEPGEQLPWPKIEVRLRFEKDDIKARYSALVAETEAKLLAAIQAEHREGRKLRDRARNNGTVQLGIRDHLGHPEARGCRHCYESGDACSILENEFEWPCEACADAGRLCSMVIPPARKLACQKCIALGKRNKDLVCSFTGDGEPSESCSNCQEHGYSCAARPDPATIRPRSRIDSDGQTFTYERPQLPNHEPVDAGEHSSSDVPEEPSLFVPQDLESGSDESEPEPKTPSALDDPAPQPPVQKTIPPVFMKSAYQIFREARAKRPMCMKLKTKFCHPMVFNHIPTENDPCSFCSNVKFQYYGHIEEKTPLVVEQPGGQGWKELKEGHAAEGRPRSKMCRECTCDRGLIICCAGHRLQEIRGSDKISTISLIEELDYDWDDHKVCSVCISAAQWECTTANANADGSAQSCGLRLCETCHVTLLGYKGNLTQMLTELQDRQGARRPRGLRADYELLRNDGLLCRFITKQ